MAKPTTFRSCSLRASPGFAAAITPEESKKRYDQCQRALDKLAAKFAEVKPDVVVIIGNDQREMFTDENTPAFLVYTGSKIENIPETEEAKAKFPPGIAIAEIGHCPPGGAVYNGSAELGVHLVTSLMDQEFDVSESSKLPKVDGHDHGIPHAFGFLYRRIMVDNPPPSVPVFLNAGIPNNLPKIPRCLKFGRALMKAIESWKEDAKVAVFASGGLTHFVIDEDLDQRVLKAMQTADESALAAIPEKLFAGQYLRDAELDAPVRGHECAGEEDEPGGLRRMLSDRGGHGQRDGFRLLAIGMTGGDEHERRRGGKRFCFAAEELDCCAVSDALDKLQLKGAVTGLPSWLPGRGASPVAY